MSYLLDTCVISELVAKRPNPEVIRWIDEIDETRLYLSSITIGEIKKGVEKLAPSARRQALAEWLEEQLFDRFQGRILSLDADVMLVWGELCAGLEKQGRPMPAIDSLLAATALHGRLTLVTRNESDFAHAGVPVFNPWIADHDL